MPVKEMRLELKLDEIFGRQIPDDPVLRADIAQEAIDIIVARTSAGKDVSGAAFEKLDPKYAKYKKGITGSAKANLSLLGDMLESIETVEESRDTVVLGFSDELQNAKAYNHNTGDTLPQREFFGLTDKEKKRIASKFAQDVEAQPELITAKQLAKENRLLEALRFLNDEADQLTFDKLLEQTLRGRRG